jgi:autotransporter-associated beta strand protein
MTTNYFTGGFLGAGDDWFTASNWSSGKVPTADDDVVINGLLTSAAQISTGTAVAKSVTVALNNVLDVQGTSGVLQVADNIVIDGNLSNELVVSNGGLVTAGGEIEVGGSLLGILGYGTVVIGGASTATASGTINADIALNADESILEFNATNNFTYAYDVSGDGSVVQKGSGQTTTLTGDNSYSGTTTILAGTLRIGNGGTSGTLGSGAIANSGTLVFDRSDGLTLNGAYSGTGALGLMGGGTYTLTTTDGATGGITIAPGTALQVGAGGSTGSLGSNAVTDNGTLDFDLAGATTVANVIGGTGQVGVLGGTVTLTGANAFSGGVFVDGGTLKAGSASAFGTGGPASVAAGATLDLHGFSQRFSSLTGAGAVDNTGAAATLSINDAAADTFSGVIENSSGAISLVKNGAGILTLQGADSYSGATTINAGAIDVENSAALGAASGGVSVASGAALQITGGISVGAEALSLAGAGLSNGGALESVSGDNAYGGAITLTAATTIDADADTLTLQGAIGGAGQNLTIGGAGDVVIDGAVNTGTGSLTIDGAGRVSLDAANTYSGGTTVDSGQLELGQNGGAGTGPITFGSQAYATLVLDPGVDPANPIALTDSSNAIEFKGLAYAAGDHLVLLSSGAVSAYALEDASGDVLQTLNFTGSYNPGLLTVGTDGAGGLQLATAYTVAQVLSNPALLNSGQPIFINDSGADIEANLAALVAEGAKIASITTTGAPVTVSVATYLADQTTLDKITNGFAISDTGADISASLDALSDADIQSITISDNAPISLSIAQMTSDAATLGKLADASGGPVQFAVVDTAANIEAAIGTLESEAGQIASITSTSGVVTVSTAAFDADKSVLDKVNGGFAISDTAADITGDLDNLGDPNLQTISISDNGAIGASMLQLTNDATQIGKLVDANGSPYQLAVTDTAANISNGLDLLQSDLAHLGSVTISDNGTIVASATQMTTDAGALGELVDASGSPYQIAIVDTAANIEANLSALVAENAHISTITSTVGQVLVSTTQFSADQSTLDKIVSGFGVSDSVTNIVATLPSLNADTEVKTVVFSSGDDTLTGVAQINAPSLMETGSTTILTIGENFTYGGVFTQGAGATTSVSSGDTLTFTNTNVLSGATTGAGTLAMTSGHAILASGATVSTANWSVSGTNTALTVGTPTHYAGAFSASSNVSLSLTGGVLNLLGAVNFSGAVENGSHLLYTQGTTTISGLTIGGTAGLQNTKTVTQSGGNVKVGDGVGNVAGLYNSKTATWAIADNSGIARGTATGSFISNTGLFEKTGGTGASVISVSFLDTGTVTVNSGTLSFSGPKNILAGAINGAGAVQFSGGTTTLGAGATVSAATRFSETGSATLLAVGENLSYAGAFTQGVGASLNVGPAYTLNLTGTTSLAGKTTGSGTLALTGGHATLSSGATVSAAHWSISGASTSVTFATPTLYAGAFSASSGATLALTGGVLNLTGSATLAGAVESGSHLLYTQGATTISGLTIGGTAGLQNTMTVTQSGGNVKVGDAAGNVAGLYNTSTGTWAIADDSGIGHGSATTSSVSNKGLFEKTGGTGTSAISASFFDAGTVTVSSGTLSFSGPTNNFAGAINGAGTVQFAGGSSIFNPGATVSAATNLSEIGATTKLAVGEDLAYAGAFTQGAGASLNVGAAHTLTLSGSTNLAGITTGAGTLAMTGGAATIAGAATISTSLWSISGPSTTVTFGKPTIFAGAFFAGSGATLALTGGILNLTGSATFANAVETGSQLIYTKGATTISGLVIGGTAGLQNTKTVTQIGGDVTLGDMSGDAAGLYNSTTGTWAITDDSGIGQGSSTSSLISNTGLFEKTGGTGTSMVAPSISNTGKVAVSSGMLDLQGAVSGTGTLQVSNGATLELDGAVATGQTLAYQAGSTGEFALDGFDVGAFFHGSVSGWAAGDQLEIGGPFSASSSLLFTENNAHTSGTLSLKDGANQESMTFLGNYSTSNFTLGTAAGSGALVTFHA